MTRNHTPRNLVDASSNAGNTQPSADNTRTQNRARARRAIETGQQSYQMTELPRAEISSVQMQVTIPGNSIQLAASIRFQVPLEHRILAVRTHLPITAIYRMMSNVLSLRLLHSAIQSYMTGVRSSNTQPYNTASTYRDSRQGDLHHQNQGYGHVYTDDEASDDEELKPKTDITTSSTGTAEETKAGKLEDS
ncbi:hypothetical protein IAT40_007292 [Kwoniella sp. CBS 6097]